MHRADIEGFGLAVKLVDSVIFGLSRYTRRMRVYTPGNFKPVPERAERVFKGVIYDVYHWQQEMFDGSFETFEMLKRPDTVKVIPVIGDQLVLTRQTQPGTKEFIDFPGGIHSEEKETELAAAKRELKEETGLTFKHWRLLGAVQPNKKIEQCVYTFLAYELETEGKQSLDNGEKIEVLKLSLLDWQSYREDPRVRHYPRELFDGLGSLEELLARPALYQYE